MVVFNWVTGVCLGGIIFHSILHAISIFLNLFCFTTQVPAEFATTYDKEAYAKSQRYTKANSIFQLISSMYSTAVFLLLWFTGVFNAIDIWSRSFELNPVITGVGYLFVVFGITFLTNIPFSIYSTFVLEDTFGFNKTTLKTYVADQLKTIALSIALGSPLIAIILSLLEKFGPSAWFFCWISAALFSILMMFIAPKYLLPLFNKLTPLEDDELKDRIRNLADRIHFSYGAIFVMDGSKRSGHSNAFFAGMGSSKRIVLFDTLLAKQTSEEIISILGHEMGHYKLGHVYSNLVLSISQMLGLFFAMKLFVSTDALFAAFLLEKKSYYAGLFFFSQILTPITFLIELFSCAFSRHNEYQADKFAIDCIENPDCLVTGLKKLSLDNLSNLTPHWLIVFLTYTHPPVLQRIEAIRSYVKSKSYANEYVLFMLNDEFSR